MYTTEFPDYILDIAIPADWVDVSWHNDSCPSWLTPNGFKVMADYAAPVHRECSDYPRFAIIHPDGMDILATDDWLEVLNTLRYLDPASVPGAILTHGDACYIAAWNPACNVYDVIRDGKRIGQAVSMMDAKLTAKVHLQSCAS